MHKITCAGVQDPRDSAVNGIISRVLAEQFKTVQVFRALNNEADRTVIAGALNIFYVCTDVFEARLVNLTLPLMVALKDSEDAVVDVCAALLCLYESCHLASRTYNGGRQPSVSRIRGGPTC